MSKVSRDKKKALAEGKELKGKQKKIAEATAEKTASEISSLPKQKSSNALNYGKCVSCVHFPHKLHGEVQPCKITGSYVARKCESCPKNAYKCKYEG